MNERVGHDLDALIDPDDREYVSRIADAAEREVVLSSLLRHRVPERLAAGDPVPDVTLTRLDPSGVARLDELVAGRAAVLVFGSYT